MFGRLRRGKSKGETVSDGVMEPRFGPPDSVGDAVLEKELASLFGHPEDYGSYGDPALEARRRWYSAVDRGLRPRLQRAARGQPVRQRTALLIPRPVPVPVLVVGLTLLAAGVAFALSSITNLGRPTNDVPAYAPIGSFRHAGPFLRSSGKPELLFIGTYVDFTSAAERWPLVKALDQFGSFSSITPTTTRDCGMTASWQPICRSQSKVPADTYNWEHARYQSRYLSFVHTDLLDPDLQMRQRLSPLELSLFNRYALLSPSIAHLLSYKSFRDAVWYTAVDTPELVPPRGLPLVSIGGYLAIHEEVATPGDLENKLGTVSVPFDSIQKSLQQDRPVGGASASMVFDFNAEANILTALICHADGSKPASVCGRPAIKAILKSVR